MNSRRKSEIDRFVELTEVGAQKAANALAQLAGRTIRTEVPVVFQAETETEAASDSARSKDSRRSTGVFFEFEGCLDALVGILFPGVASEALVRRIIGIETGPLAPQVIESAVMEVGNILASHVASAIADRLESRLLPSIPSLAMENAEQALRSFVEDAMGPDALRIESVLSDESGELHGRLVLVPTRFSVPPRDRSDSESLDL